MKKRKRPTVSYEEGLLARLKDPEYASNYLNAVLEGRDSGEFLIALQHVTKAHGVTTVARKAHLGRESMYKTLSGKISPKLETVDSILHALGLKISVARAS